MFVFYDWPFLHVYFAKNVADSVVPFYSWFCFQRLCRLLWGCHQGVGSLVWSLWPNELSISWKFICPHWKGHFWGEYLLSCLKVEGVWKLCCHCYFAAWLHWLAVIYFILCPVISTLLPHSPVCCMSLGTVPSWAWSRDAALCQISLDAC